MKGRFEQYGEPLLFAAPISLWLTSRYFDSRNIKLNLIQKTKKALLFIMKAHLCYPVGKECNFLYQRVSSGENFWYNVIFDLKDNFFTQFFFQTFYFSQSLLGAEAFKNLLLIFPKGQKNKHQDVEIQNYKEEKGEEEESEKCLKTTKMKKNQRKGKKIKKKIRLHCLVDR